MGCISLDAFQELQEHHLHQLAGTGPEAYLEPNRRWFLRGWDLHFAQFPVV